MASETISLTLEARSLLLLDQRGLGTLLGASRRTVQRWDNGQSKPTPDQLARLASAVYREDPFLGARLASAAGTTPERLGLAAPQPPPLPPVAAAPEAPAPAAPDPTQLVDLIVCAAADALSAAPSVVRPVLLAAFRRACEIGLAMEDIERALALAVEGQRAPKAGQQR